ncbi:restriction endonuclease subunit S [Enterococcus faecalis]|uniref:restriction endonuclease subunit S n=1 Tax=Enterococcus faecalis TaxID=1351 RepID=UPI001141C9A7|nr:restriction endonuclease subunit S [Enterococcus faecalis]TQA92915.1 restriction endonuclease subunit S [Enterococcus faecalis]
MNLLIVFTLIGVWELCKLGTLAEIVRGASPRPIQDSKWFDNTSDVGWLRISDVTEQNGRIYKLEQKLSKAGQEKTRVLRKPHLLLSIAATVGKPVVNYVNTGVHDGFLIFLNPLFDREFMFQWLEMFTPKWQKYGQPGSQLNLNSELVRNQELRMPSTNEQEKIGMLFQYLDDTITLHQRKLEQLKELKKAYLQVMFPRKDERVPKLRFADFEGEWAQRKLGEISTHRSGTAIERYFTEDGKYKVISIGSYGTDSKYVDQGIRAISNEITNARVVHKGELTMVLNDKTSDGAIIGRSLLIESEEEYVINQRTEIISPKDDFNVNFAYTTLNNTFRQKVKKIVQGGTQIYVNYPAVKNLMLDFPSYKEQTKIGTFFKQFDDTITLHQNKLDQLKTLKKTYLQNMFI